MDILDQLEYRVSCLYRSLGKTNPRKVTELQAKHTSTPKVVGMHLDFREGLSDGEIRQSFMDVVFHVAHLKDLVKKWLLESKYDPQLVEKFINEQESLCIISDLANVDKHGYPLRSFRSKHEPRLGKVGRSLELSTGAKAGSSVCLVLDPKTGIARVVSEGGGQGQLILEGEVFDKTGRVVGQIMDVLDKGISAWEEFLRKHRAIREPPQ